MLVSRRVYLPGDSIRDPQTLEVTFTTFEFGSRFHVTIPKRPPSLCFLLPIWEGTCEKVDSKVFWEFWDQLFGNRCAGFLLMSFKINNSALMSFQKF